MSGLVVAITAAAPSICDAAALSRAETIAATAPRDTGALADSWEVATQGGNDGAISTLKFTADYASYLDEGTGPHEIVGNPLLAFDWGGTTVIVHSVQHPGSTKNVDWFSGPALDESAWALAVQEVLSGVAIV
jgi:hypothetical protein